MLLHAKLVQEPCVALGPAEASAIMEKQLSHSTGTATSEDEKRIAVPLAKILMSLQEHIPHLVPFFQEEFLSLLFKVFKPATAIEKMPGNI